MWWNPVLNVGPRVSKATQPPMIYIYIHIKIVFILNQAHYPRCCHHQKVSSKSLPWKSVLEAHKHTLMILSGILRIVLGRWCWSANYKNVFLSYPSMCCYFFPQIFVGDNFSEEKEGKVTCICITCIRNVPWTFYKMYCHMKLYYHGNCGFVCISKTYNGF